jgi:hypothetical protein
MQQAGRNGEKLKVPFRPALADGRVMHVGQPVALVIAESFALAEEAADHIEVVYDQPPGGRRSLGNRPGGVNTLGGSAIKRRHRLAWHHR